VVPALIYGCGLSPRFRPRVANPVRQRNVHSLRVFGGISIETSAGPLSGRATQRRRLALLALLATSRALSREKLIALLWPDVETERGRRLLSDSVYRINSALHADAIVAVADELRLDADVLPSDVAAFEAARAEARHDDAVALHTGPFLDGFFLDGAPEFEQWVTRERDRLVRACGASLEALAEAAAAAGAPSQAAEWWYRAASLDPLSPRVALRLMQALDAAGERAAALRHAQVYETLFRDEVGAEIDPAIHDLAERLRREPLRPPGDASRAADEHMATALAAAVDATPQPADAPAAARPARDRSRLSTAAALLLPVLVIAGWLTLRNGSAAPPAVTSPAVAVLPFADRSPAGDHAYFAAGIMEEVASRLSRIDGLRVIAPAAAATGSDADLQALGRRLGAETVLGGSITRWGDSVRVNARLIRVSDLTYLWSETYTSPVVSIFAIQDSIARAIGGTLLHRLVGRRVVAGPASAAELQAYHLYLKGRFAWHRRTQQSLADAVEHLEEAVTVAPSYARAHAGLADAYAVQGFYDYRPPDDAFPRARAAALRALELDPSLAQAHATLGYVSLYYDWHWDEAERAFARAIELDPGYSTAYQWQANYYTAMGRFAEAEQAMRRAMELDPLSLIANGALGWVHYHAGDFTGAIEQCERTLELDGSFQLAWLWSGLAGERLGNHEDAIRRIERALSLSPRSAVTQAALAHAYAVVGRRDEARALLATILAAPRRYVPSFEIAKVHLALGDSDTALQWLETAYQQRSHSMAFLKVDPQLAGLQADVQFRALLRKVGHR
jgi:DNA-binding SARP family transcriptional activator/TolB-like protein/Tfp pilus assembly protein PilF